MPVFEDGASSTLREVNAVFTQRGAQYKDTWHTDNQPPGFVDALRATVGEDRGREANRLVRLAGLVDTKISRITSGGDFNGDHYIDLIAYLALLKDLHEAYKPPTFCCAQHSEIPPEAITNGNSNGAAAGAGEKPRVLAPTTGRCVA